MIYNMRRTYNTVIVGAGLSGLSLAWLLLQQNRDNRIPLIEKQKLAGGAIKTYHDQGFLVEEGPHGFLDNCQAGRELLKGIHLEGLVQLGDFSRYICMDEALQRIPQNMPAIVRSKILPLSAKLRVFADLWKKPLSGNPSVMDDETLVHHALQDIIQLLPLTQKPIFCKVIRTHSGIPQHEEGYKPLQEWQRDTMKENHGLHICGFCWGGIDVNNMISESRRTAETFLAASTSAVCNRKPESVYF